MRITRLQPACFLLLVLVLTLWSVAPAGVWAQGDQDNHEAQVLSGKQKIAYDDGSPRAEATYKDGLLHGTYRAFAKNGRLVVRAQFKDGRRHGKLERWNPDGKRVEVARFDRGVLHGKRVVFADGKPALEQTYARGELTDSQGDSSLMPGSLTYLFKNQADGPDKPSDAGDGALTIDTPKPKGYPHSLAELKAALDKIAELEIKGVETDEQAEGTRRIILHRFAAGVPDFVLDHDPADAEFARLASKICHMLGRNDHNPPNPGLPEAEYKKGAKGAKGSNLANGYYNPTEAVDGWMYDIGEHNRDRVGHRRWILAPGLFEVGYGWHGEAHAMYVAPNHKRTDAFDLITYPGRGYTPVELYDSKGAPWNKGIHIIWSAHPSPRHYRLPQGDGKGQIKVEVTRLTPDGQREPVGIQRVHVTPEKPALRGVLFEPMIDSIEHGDRYEVKLKGLQPARKGLSATLTYEVHFVDTGKL